MMIVVGLLVLVGLSQAMRVTRDPCFNMECYNGGQCVSPADSPYCVCKAGYAGDHCQTKMTTSVSMCPAKVACTENYCSRDVDCARSEVCCPNSCGSYVCVIINPL